MPKLKRPEFVNRLNTKGNKRKAVGLGVLLVIAAIGFGVWSFFINDNKKVYAQAAGHKVYEKEVKELIGDNKSISDHDAAKVLADKYLTEALAKEEGIIVTEQDIEKQYGREMIDQRDKNKYSYQNQVNKLYLAKLQSKSSGTYKGKLLVANFSRYVPFESALLEEDKRADPKIGDPAAIAQDKKYAQDLITRLYDEIKSGKITFDQAIQIERNDPVVGEKIYPTLVHSGTFDSTNQLDELVSNESIRRQISRIKSSEFSKPFVVRTANSMEGNKLAESYFLAIQMDEASNGDPDFKRYLEEAEKRLEYEIYV